MSFPGPYGIPYVVLSHMHPRRMAPQSSLTFGSLKAMAPPRLFRPHRFQLTSISTSTTESICFGYPMSMFMSRWAGLLPCLGEYGHFLLSHRTYVQIFPHRPRIRTCTSFFVFLSLHTCIFSRPNNAAMHNDEVVHVIYLP